MNNGDRANLLSFDFHSIPPRSDVFGSDATFLKSPKDLISLDHCSTGVGSAPYNGPVVIAALKNVILGLCLGLALGSDSAFGQAQPSARVQGLTLSADSLFRDNEADTVELSGSVQIIAQDRHISADKAKIDLRSRQAELTGNVRLATSSSTIIGERILFDYESGTGIIYNGYVQSGPVMFEGSVIQKTGPEEYYVVEADYTTCTNCPATWNFSGSSIRAELGGYAYIKRPVLRVGGVPILPLPYLIVPLKSDRQSGLLTPGFEQSTTGGFTLEQPYFWAISRSTDATFILKHYELRGLKGQINGRYMLDEESDGEIDVGSLSDRVFAKDTRLTRYQSSAEQASDFERWFLRYHHYQVQDNGWIHRASINTASDLQYFKDFPNDGYERGSTRPLIDQDPAMESRISSTKNTHHGHFSVDASYYQNLLQSNPLASNDDAVHRLPEIRYSQVPQSIRNSGFYYALELNYSNFARDGAAYDQLSTQVVDGERRRYVENTCNSPGWASDPNCERLSGRPYDRSRDLIRAGQRLDFQPSLSYPITVTSGVDMMPTLSYRETHYTFPIEGVESNVRRYLRAEVAARVSFNRIYGDGVDPKATRYKHEIRPEVTYTATPWISHNSHPFFGFRDQTEVPTFESLTVSDSDLFGDFGLQFDYRDRIYDRNLVTYSLVNTITEKRWVNERPLYKQLALIRLSQSYDAFKAARNDPNQPPLSDISLLADLRLDRIRSYTQLNYYPYQKYVNASSRVRVNDEWGRFAEVGVSRLVTPPARPQDPVDISKRTEDYTLAAGVISRYLNLMGKLTYDSVAAADQPSIKSWAYIAQFKPPGDCWIITAIHDQNTDGDTNIRLAFEFNFDGIPKAPLPQNTLDAYGR